MPHHANSANPNIAQVRISITHDCNVIATPQGIKFGNSMITWGWLEAAKIQAQNHNEDGKVITKDETEYSAASAVSKPPKPKKVTVEPPVVVEAPAVEHDHGV